MGSKRYLLRAEETPWKAIDDEEAVLLKLKDSTYYSLDQVGLKIWKLSDGTKNTDDIAGKIAKEYNISVNKAKADIENFVNQLKKEELLIERTTPFKK